MATARPSLLHLAPTSSTAIDRSRDPFPYSSPDAFSAYREPQLCWYRRAHCFELLPDSRELEPPAAHPGGMSSVVLRLRTGGDESVAQFERMIALAKKLGNLPSQIVAMSSLSVRLATLARYAEAAAVNAEIVAMVPRSPGTDAARALTLFWQGKVAETIAVLEPLTRRDHLVEPDHRMGILDPTARRTVLMSYLGAAYWAAGRPDAGVAEIARAHRIALEAETLTRSASARSTRTVHYLRRDPSPSCATRGADPHEGRRPDQPGKRCCCCNWRGAPRPRSRAPSSTTCHQFRERFRELPMAVLLAIQSPTRSTAPARRHRAAFVERCSRYARAVGSGCSNRSSALRCRLVPTPSGCVPHTRTPATSGPRIALRLAWTLREGSVAEALAQIAAETRPTSSRRASARVQGRARRTTAGLDG